MRVDEFQWQTQLKGMYDTTKQDFFFRIADACLAYGYEYLGNGPRLVITPLTDRIYVTAT
jgi:dynein heavy chain